MVGGGPGYSRFTRITTARGAMTYDFPKNIEIGKPTEKPEILVEPVVDPVPREVPVKTPQPVKAPVKEPVPA